MIIPVKPGEDAPECRVVPPQEDDVVGTYYPPCVGAGCAHFRLQPILADARFVEAVKKAAEDIGDTSHNRAKAAAHVNANKAKYGMPIAPTHGYCGLAGKPEVV